MKKYVIAAAMAFSCLGAAGEDKVNMQTLEVVQSQTDDYVIVSDEVRDGVRYVTATPSAKVCSKRIDIEIVDNIIIKVVYTRGCEGNAKGIGALIKGMSVNEAIRRLEGITCGKRGTSCPDQLSKILKALD